jgi:hypothetical protein
VFKHFCCWSLGAWLKLPTTAGISDVFLNCDACISYPRFLSMGQQICLQAIHKSLHSKITERNKSTMHGRGEREIGAHLRNKRYMRLYNSRQCKAAIGDLYVVDLSCKHGNETQIATGQRSEATTTEQYTIYTYICIYIAIYIHHKRTATRSSE